MNIDSLENLPKHLTVGQQQFCCADDAKRPVNPLTGRAASTKNRTGFTTLSIAVDAVEKGIYRNCVGVGPLCTYDADHIAVVMISKVVRNDGTLEPFAGNIVNMAGSYAEVTPDGTGIIIAFKCLLPASTRDSCCIILWPKGTVPNLPEVEVRLFVRGLYVALTGETITPGVAVEWEKGFEGLAARKVALARKASQPNGQATPLQAKSLQAKRNKRAVRSTEVDSRSSGSGRSGTESRSAAKCTERPARQFNDTCR